MLGHILRSDNNTPAYQSFIFATFGSKSFKGHIGRHKTNLYDLILKDLDKRELSIYDNNDFINLVELAQNRQEWKRVRNFSWGQIRDLGALLLDLILFEDISSL